MRMSNLCDVYRDTAAAPGGTALDHAKLRDTLVCMADGPKSASSCPSQLSDLSRIQQQG